MKAACPRLVIAGNRQRRGQDVAHAGAGAAGSRGRACACRPSRSGPDFLDPTYLAMASGRTCYNLDGWMTSREYVGELFARATADADIALDRRRDGHVRRRFAQHARRQHGRDRPLAGRAGAAWWSTPTERPAAWRPRSRALPSFEPGVRVAGVIANQGGSPAASARGWPNRWPARPRRRWWACCPADRCPRLPSRHLGLVDRRAGESVGRHPRSIGRRLRRTPGRAGADRELARVVGRGVLHVRRSIAGRNLSAAGHVPATESPPGHRPRRGLPLLLSRQPGIAGRGRGRVGAVFAACTTRGLPADLDGLYFGGGYPEVHAARLAANADDARRRARSSPPRDGRVYAECGGLMYLGRMLTCLDGARYPMAGVLPIETAMLEKLKVLGYAEVAWAADSLWGAAGQVARGHEFHYSEITAEPSPADGWQPAYTVRRRRAEPARGRFLPRARPGRLRPPALGLAAGGHRSLSLLLRATIMNQCARRRRRHPDRQPRQPAGRGQPGLRGDGRAGGLAVGRGRHPADLLLHRPARHPRPGGRAGGRAACGGSCSCPIFSTRDST